MRINKKLITIALILIFLFLLLFNNNFHIKQASDYPTEKAYELEASISEIEKTLWDNTVEIYLEDDLWTSKNIYDAGHTLMIPLHAAFRLNQNDWQLKFSQHFNRFTLEMKKTNNNVEQGRLNRLHYLYLASQFLTLAKESDKDYLIPPDMVNILYNEIGNYWSVQQAEQWDSEPFKGIKERVEWKLANKEVKRSYYRAIIDEELFIFAIAADLRTYEQLTFEKSLWSPQISDILEKAFIVFQNEVFFGNDGGWLFQPGVWTDHPDYAYAGYKDKNDINQPIPVRNIAVDSSHSHRFPLWLRSLSNAYPKNSTEQVYYENLQNGLEKQFFNKVLVQPTKDFSGYRMNNFMDGSNGVYRWNYATQGTGNGYGPYELSGTLIEGWWGFLGGEGISKVYRDLSEAFPLDKSVINVYVGPNTTRERHYLVSWPNYFTNGFAELNCRLVSEINELDH